MSKFSDLDIIEVGIDRMRLSIFCELHCSSFVESPVTSPYMIRVLKVMSRTLSDARKDRFIGTIRFAWAPDTTSGRVNDSTKQKSKRAPLPARRGGNPLIHDKPEG